MLKEVVPKMARVAVMQAFRIFAQTTIWQNSPHPYERDAALRRVERHPAVVRMEARLLRRLEHWIALQSDSPDLIRQTARPRYITWPDPLFPFSVAATATP